MGSIIQAQWFADSAWTVSTGLVDVGLGHAIAAVALVAVTVVNLLGIKLAVRLNRVVGAVFVVVLIGLIVLPFAMGDWSADNLSFHADGPWGGGAKVVIVWLYLGGAWSIYGSELCASFAPEYRNPAVDTARAMKTIALILIGLYALVPPGHVGSPGRGGRGGGGPDHLRHHRVSGHPRDGGLITGRRCALRGALPGHGLFRC